MEAAAPYLAKAKELAMRGPVMMWTGFALVVLVVFTWVSDRDFSFLLSLAALMRCFGLGFLVFKVLSERHVRGVSLKTLELYALVFFFRLLSIFRHQGYLPYDKTGDFLYHIVELGGLALSVGAGFLVFHTFLTSYEERYDSFGKLHLPSEAGAVYAIAPCLVLAMIMHPSLNNDWFSDVSWTASMYLESVAIVPQLWMFRRKANHERGEVSKQLAHTFFALGAARVVELIFWCSSYRELTDAKGGRAVGLFVLLTQLVHIVIMSDFFYAYFLSIIKGGEMVLPK